MHKKNVKKLPPLSVFSSITVTESTAQKKKMMITIFLNECHHTGYRRTASSQKARKQAEEMSERLRVVENWQGDLHEVQAHLGHTEGS